MYICSGGLGNNPFINQRNNSDYNIQKESTLHSDEGIGGNGGGNTDGKVQQAAQSIFSNNGRE